MTRRLALTPAIGLFTGLSVVSFGAVSMWLTGVHGSPALATSPCAVKTPKKTAAPTTSATHTSARVARTSGAHTATHLPILLDAATRTISTGRAAQHSASAAPHSPSRDALAAATSTSPPVPSTGPQPSAPATPPVPDPTPGGGNVTPNPSTGAPNPGSTGNIPAKSPRHNPTVTPGGTNKTAGPTATATPTATPTPTSTTTPATATLCLSVQTLGGSNTVQPGTTVGFAIWVGLSSGTGGTVKISISSARKGINPTFTVCQPTGKSTCTVSGLNAGDHVQTQAELSAGQNLAGHHITLNVTATSKQAANTVTASDRILVASTNNSPSPTPTLPNNGPGNGGSLPPASLPGGGSNPYASVTNPAGNLGSSFPQVSPSPNVSPSTAKTHQQQHIEVTDLSAGLPLTVRLIGGQLIGLAILAAAVTIAVARLSLRRQPARHSDDNADSTHTT